MFLKIYIYNPIVTVIIAIKQKIEGNEYKVTMYDSGFDCTCIAFRKCKHIKEVEKRIVGED